MTAPESPKRPSPTGRDKSGRPANRPGSKTPNSKGPHSKGPNSKGPNSKGHGSKGSSSKGAGSKPGGPKSFGPRTKSEEPDGPRWLYGIHAVEAALANPDRRIQRLVATRNAARPLQNPPLEPEVLAPEAIAALLPAGAVHQGLAILTEPLEEPSLASVLEDPAPSAPIVLLDRVTDPQNIGAVLRSCAVFGARAVITTWRRSPPVTGALAKAATGGVEHVPYLRVNNLARAIETVKEAGYSVWGLAEEGSEPITALRPEGPVALILGAEGDGLRSLTRDLCDRLVHIPTPGPIKALNVSNAAAIALCHVTSISLSSDG